MAADPRLIEFARAMRREPTPAEEVLWRHLRNRQLTGFKFRRQHPLGLYIADFYSATGALVVELDGDSHTTEEGVKHDRLRHDYMKSLNLSVIRFWNAEVHENIEGVMGEIERACLECQGRRRRAAPIDHRRVRPEKQQ